MEDDINLIPDYRANLISTLKNLPSDWDIVYLFTYEISKKYIEVSNNRYLKKLKADNKKVYSTAGYLINYASAKKLLDLSTNFSKAIDCEISNYINKKELIAYKTTINYLTAPIAVEPEDSTIYGMGRSNY